MLDKEHKTLMHWLREGYKESFEREAYKKDDGSKLLS